MLSPSSQAFILPRLTADSHLLYIMSAKKSTLHQIKGPFKLFILKLSPLIAPECTFLPLPHRPTLVLNITLRKQNILWHDHSWYNSFKPASPSAEVFKYIYPAGKQTFSRTLPGMSKGPQGNQKHPATPWAPTSWCNMTVWHFRLILGDWFCFSFGHNVF